MLVKDYDYYEFEEELNFLEDVPAEKEQKIIKAVEELAREYRKGIDAKDYKIVIPLGKILEIKIDGNDLNAAEIQVAYDYINEAGYSLRGNDSTAENELEGYSRFAVNKTLLNDATKPYPKRTQKRKLRMLAEYKRMLDAYESLDIDNCEDANILEAYQQTLTKYKELREDLITHSLRLAITIVKKFYKYNLSEEDKYMLSFMLTIKAVDKYIFKFYQEASKNQLSTYVNVWNLNLGRFIVDEARTIRIPANILETINKIANITRELEESLGYTPTDKDLADQLGLPPERVRELKEFANDAINYDALINEELENIYENGYYEEGIMQDSSITEDGMLPLNMTPLSVDPFEMASYTMLQDDINRILDVLAPREQKVISLRFGLVDGIPRTLEEVAEEFGVTRERIRQIESKTLAKLRHPLRSSKVYDYIR